MFITLFRIILLLLRVRFFSICKRFDIAAKLVKLGPAFVKFGQTLSTRPDIFGKDITDSLIVLCDKLAPFSFEEVKGIIEKEFNKGLKEVFPYFEQKAVSSASIAQVHKAYTQNGQLVAVKILRPDIERNLKKNITLLRFCVLCSRPFLPRRFRVDDVLKLFTENIKYELDLRFEAANASELRKNIADDEKVYIPEVYWEFTTNKVLTMQWMEGKSIAEFDYDPEIAEILAVSFVKQTYYHGVFHGDMHPGNLLVTADRKLVLVDFGIIGRLDEKTKIYVAEILIGFLRRDYKYVADVHFRAGYVSSQYNNFVTACCAIGEPMMGKRVSVARLFGQLFKITSDFNISIQPQLLLLQKTLLLVEGHCIRLCPEIDLWELIKPHMENWASDHLGVKKKVCNTQVVRKIQSIFERVDDLLNYRQDKKNDKHFVHILIFLIVLYLIIDKIL